MYTYIEIPPLPEKVKTDDDSITKGLILMRRFLDGVIRTPLFLCAPVVKSFFGEDRSLYENVIKMESKKKKVERVEEMWSVTGSVACLTSPYPTINLHDYFSLSKALKHKLIEQFCTLTDALHQLSFQLTAIAESFSLLVDLQNLVPEAHPQQRIYSGMSNLITEWRTRESEAAVLVQQYGEYFFLGERMEMEEMLEMVKERDVMREVWERGREKLDEKKEKLWGNGDVAKWDLSADARANLEEIKNDKSHALLLMLPSETSEITRLHRLFTYHNYQLKSELTRVLTNAACIESLQISELGRLLDENRQSFCLELRRFQGELSEFY